MSSHHAVLHPFGWGSLVGGAVAAGIGQASGSELGGLAWTYGVLVVMAAAYLLIGLHLYTALIARRRSASTASRAQRTEASGA